MYHSNKVNKTIDRKHCALPEITLRGYQGILKYKISLNI